MLQTAKTIELFFPGVVLREGGPMKEEQSIITVDELADLLGVHRITIYRHLKESGLPGFKVGRIWRFQRDEVFTWIAQQQTKTPD